MTQLAGLRFYLQQTSDDRQLSFLPPLDYFTGLPHQLPGQRQELVITIAHALPTDFCWGLRRAADLQQAVLHGSLRSCGNYIAAFTDRGGVLPAAAQRVDTRAPTHASSCE